MKLLDIQNLNVAYFSGGKRITAVNDVSMTIESGESVGVVGESGSGKSTLAMAVLGLLPQKTTQITGKIDFLGTELLSCSEQQLKEIRWKQLSVVFQRSMNGLSPVHRIRTQFEDIYRVKEKAATKQEIRERVLKLFEVVNLSDRVYELYPHELSGGMLQRVSIALSLLFQPSMVILDEATTALDVVTQGQILSEMKRLEKEMNVTTMTITHDMSVVATACKRVAVMYAGRLMEFGETSTVLTKPLHPYTQGLLKSFPTLRGERGSLKGIPGSLTDLSKQQQGCVFAQRCSEAMDICRSSQPEEYAHPNNHRVACHLYGGEAK